MTARKKIPSIAEQARQVAAELSGWVRGETRLRTTIATKGGGRTIAHATRPELEAKLQRAKALQAIRADLGMSQPSFAHLIQSTPPAVRQWEQGRRAIPNTVFALAELARAMPAVRKRLEAMTASASGAAKVAGSRKRAF